MHSRFALLAPLLFCGLAAGAHEPMTRLTINVVNTSGNPLEHADVTIKVVKDGKPKVKFRIRTREDGVVKPPEELPQGTIVVEASADEYAHYSQQFEVHDPEKTIEVRLTSGMAQINVHVTTMGGKPLDRADVVVKFVKGRSIIELGRKLRTSWEMRTNQEGLAKVPAIPRGTILIQVIASGYQTFGQQYEVDEAQRTIEIKLNSPQEQYSAH